MTLEKKIRSWLGPVIVGVLLWRAVPALGGPDLVPGPMDPRGFSAVRVHKGSGEPVRFNPCQPIHYVINPALAPPGAIDDVHTAFAMTAEASGLRFVYDGETSEAPSPDRAAHLPDLYGDRWAPILIGWAPDLGRSDLPEATPIGLGGSIPEVNDDGKAVLVSGEIVFDADYTEIPSGFGGETWGQAMLHEIGHVLGLAHYDSPDSVMNPMLGRRAAVWGAGDKAGLWLQGLGSPCVTTPQTP